MLTNWIASSRLIRTSSDNSAGGIGGDGRQHIATNENASSPVVRSTTVVVVDLCGRWQAASCVAAGRRRQAPAVAAVATDGADSSRPSRAF